MMRREELLAHYARVRAHYRALAPAYSREANQTCEGRYRDIVQRVMSGRARVLELGSGSNALLDPSALPLRGLRPLHRHAAAAQDDRAHGGGGGGR